MTADTMYKTLAHPPSVSLNSAIVGYESESGHGGIPPGCPSICTITVDEDPFFRFSVAFTILNSFVASMLNEVCNDCHLPLNNHLPAHQEEPAGRRQQPQNTALL